MLFFWFSDESHKDNDDDDSSCNDSSSGSDSEYVKVESPELRLDESFHTGINKTQHSPADIKLEVSSPLSCRALNQELRKN